MKVKLISHSQLPAYDLDVMNMPSDMLQLVAYCARVSNPSNQNNEKTAKALVQYLINHRHWSPLEMVNVCMEIETTRDIARQLLRHRSFSFQEFSQRYADPTQDLAFEVREARLQDVKNRQNSVEIDESHDQIASEWERLQREVIEKSRFTYNWAIKNGIAKEQARAVLPEGNTLSRLYVNGTLRSWIHYIELRIGNGTQKEHIQLAEACAQVIQKVFPLNDE
jgi:thymidylate synthase (FAD)